MADDGYTYMVTGKVVIDGKQVPTGTIVDEAKDWKYINMLVDRGKLTRVTEEAAKDSPRYERTESPESDDGDETEEEPTTTTEDAESASEGDDEGDEDDGDGEGDDEDDEGDGEGDENDEDDEYEFSQEDYNALDVDEVTELVEADELTREEVADFEKNRPGRSRKGVLALVEADADEDDADDEG